VWINCIFAALILYMLLTCIVYTFYVFLSIISTFYYFYFHTKYHFKDLSLNMKFNTYILVTNAVSYVNTTIANNFYFNQPVSIQCDELHAALFIFIFVVHRTQCYSMTAKWFCLSIKKLMHEKKNTLL